MIKEISKATAFEILVQLNHRYSTPWKMRRLYNGMWIYSTFRQDEERKVSEIQVCELYGKITYDGYASIDRKYHPFDAESMEELFGYLDKWFPQAKKDKKAKKAQQEQLSLW